MAPRERTALLSFGAASVALLPFDAHLAQHVALNVAHPGTLGRAATDVARVGDPGTVMVAGGALLIGRLTHHVSLADVGLHATEAIVLSGVLTQVGKFSVGRGRPRAVGLDEPMAFTPFRSAAGHVSFPSGHTSAAFSLAAVLDRELHRQPFAAQHTHLAAATSVALYTAATGVGIARMVQRAHWASDVAAGAGVGLASGWWTVRQRHAGRAARWERWLTGAP
jgi:membrane-associated phospholipid phosphatase